MGDGMVDTTVSPYKSIVRITVRMNGGTYQGSGVLISPDEVLTAAHLVYTTGVGLATNIQVTPGYNSGVAPFGTYSGTVTHYNAINDAGGFLYLPDIQADYAVIHLSTPTTAGYIPVGVAFSSGVATVGGYPGVVNGAQVDMPETLSTYPGYNILTGVSIGAGSSGGPVYTGEGAGAVVIGVVSASSAVTGTGYFKKLTAADRATILNWVAADDGYATTAGYVNSRTGVQGSAPLSVSSGGPSYLNWQYIWTSSDGVALSTSAPNAFLHGGPGQDSIQVTSGQNVLDGGTGSNFLTGGSGIDTFFTDARGAGVVWNTLRNFHAGDAATLWGFVAGVSSYRWDATEGGAAGSTGATLRANIVGGSGRVGDGIDASITFAGLSVGQAKSLVVTTGSQPAGSYLYFYNPGV